MAELLLDWKRDKMCGMVSEADVDSTLTLMGWVARTRNLGALIFVWLRDKTGVVQLVFDEKTCGAECFKQGECLRGEYVIAVRGAVAMRAAEAINKKLATGAVEVLVGEMKILNKAETPPMYIDDEHPDESELLHLKYRYLDIRRDSLQNMLRFRYEAARAVRAHMDACGFTEIETPIFTKSTPEGARDFLVPSRTRPGKFYALPQSPQIYKQMLMVGGCDRYFQIARCFRDEDNRSDRQPEFTQVDIEMSFVDREDVLLVVEGAFRAVFEGVVGVNLPDPLPRITWLEAMDTYGSDKPDRRFGLKLVDVSGAVASCGFSVFEGAVAAGGTVRGINAKGCADRLSRKEIDGLGEFVKTYRAKGLAWAQIKADGLKSSFGKFLSEEKMSELLRVMDAEVGDVVFFVADKLSVVRQSLGALRVEIAKKLSLIDQSVYDLFWVLEFPLFEYNEDENRLDAMHHPFTSPMDEDLHLMQSDPGKARAKAYDLVLNGIEMGSGSIRIHDSERQQRMFELMGIDKETAWRKFGFMLEAFKYGTPPHGGFAFGLDRLVMQAMRKESLRDVIAFPKSQSGECLMMQTPSEVDAEQLKALHIAVDEEPGRV